MENENKPQHKNLVAAVLGVINDIDGVEKSLDVGEGQYSYKGVPDAEVKKIVRNAMKKHGLIILPVGVEPKTEVSRWEEVYGNNKKQRQSVFTEVITKYKLMHESGESEILMGYGHGVDSQDKGAGKASTYALKYTLLYLFLIPTGKIDDSDNTHSNDHQVPQKPPQQPKAPQQNTAKKALTLDQAKTLLNGCKNVETLAQTFKSFTVKMQEAVTPLKDELKIKLSTPPNPPQ